MEYTKTNVLQNRKNNLTVTIIMNDLQYVLDFMLK